MKLLKDLGLRPSSSVRNGKVRNFSWGLYECPICGAHKEFKKGRMKGSAPKSCGCLQGELHGDTSTSLYGVWKSMRQRCSLPSNTSYKYYGEKGIQVAEEWETSYTTFKKWALDNGYEVGLSIDRKNPEGDYTPSNCRWATKEVQARNTRVLRSTNTSGYRGVSWSTTAKKWYTSISVDSTSISIGYYKDKVEAAKAYDKYVITNQLEHTTNGVLSNEEIALATV